MNLTIHGVTVVKITKGRIGATGNHITKLMLRTEDHHDYEPGCEITLFSAEPLNLEERNDDA